MINSTLRLLQKSQTCRQQLPQHPTTSVRRTMAPSLWPPTAASHLTNINWTKRIGWIRIFLLSSAMVTYGVDQRCLRIEICLNVDVPRGLTGTSYANDIKPILDTYCNFSGCHGACNGTTDWTKFNNVWDRAENIRNPTGVRNIPPIGELTQDQINMIACWVDDGALNN